MTNYGFGYCPGNIGMGTTGTGTDGIKSINITSSKNSINEGDSFDIHTTSQNILDNTLIGYFIIVVSVSFTFNNRISSL